MKVTRKIIEIDPERCDGCGLCVPSCAEGAIQVIDGKARLVAEKYCDGLGACLGECPNDALHIIERDADDFDEQAVEEYLKDKPSGEKTLEMPSFPGCPSSQLQSFIQPGSATGAAAGQAPMKQTSALTHWPVQINLVPPTAPFLKGADLVVVADCTPLAYPDFHQDFLKGKVVMMGCPKFDNVQEYIQKFTAIFKTAELKSITTVVMEVPCCSGLPWLVRKALEASGKKIPLKEKVISVRGEILQ